MRKTISLLVAVAALTLAPGQADAASPTFRVGAVAGHAHCRTTLPTEGQANLSCRDGWHKTLRPCPYEDSPNCYWNASDFGNGIGHSFIDWRGQVHYLKAARR